MTNFKTILLTLVCLFVIISCANKQTQTPEQKAFAQLDSLFGQLYPADEPGAAVLILKGDSIVYKKGFGIANMETKEPVTTKTFFNIASVSKQFSAVALMMLHEEGKLSLDDNVSTFFPQFKAPFFKTITLRHLLSHTSGIPDTRPRSDRNFVLTATDEASYAYMEKLDKLNFEPGTAYEYMNPTFQLMYTIIEKASGMKFDDFMCTRIFDVAGMAESIYFEAGKKIPHLSHGYRPNRNGEGFQKYDYGEASFFATKADGGLYTSVEEFTQWEKALRGNLLISREMSEEAWSKKIDISDTLYTGYGYGWAIEEKPGVAKKVYHTGNNGGYQIYAGRYPDKEILYLIFATRDDKNRENTVANVDEIMTAAGWLD
jgi:CubicO group peptidase (beta-lactamase class C family)